MKAIIYTLETNGTIPEYIIDGGYFPVQNNKTSPQDLDLVGIAQDDAPQEAFASEAELLNYVKEKNITIIDTNTWEVKPIEEVVNLFWEKI